MARSLQNRKAGTAMILAGIAFAMIGASFASVPLYRIFCEATGYGGTTQRTEAAPRNEATALITVRFDASTATDLDWEFRPLQAEVKLHPGEERTISYRAVNRSKEPLTGTATFNVTPFKAGIYFDKIQCFCFSEQHLEPGQSADLSVQFFVDPDILTDHDTRDVDTITLSYTMFRAKNQPVATSSAGTAPNPVN
ncbi:MAG: cytochrome c oxidase assembly protein [Rhodospirillales bacterium]|nr:cytochrome c oxidase assembly protein [Rhodospirillales bacterium]